MRRAGKEKKSKGDEKEEEKNESLRRNYVEKY
jgi:hypothetical protein